MHLKIDFKTLFIGSLCCRAMADSLPPRIATASLDKSYVHKLYVAEGRSSILIFPCNIKSFSPGPTKDIVAALNDRDSRYIEVWLGKNSGQPGGLKVLCEDQFFVFDVIPSTTTHQDILEVKKSYGMPRTLVEHPEVIEVAASNISDLNSPKVAKHKKLPKIVRTITSSKTGGRE